MAPIIAANNAIQAGNNVVSFAGDSSIISLVFVLGIVASVSLVGFIMLKD